MQTFYNHRLHTMIKKVFNYNIYRALNASYPGRFQESDLKRRSKKSSVYNRRFFLAARLNCHYKNFRQKKSHTTTLPQPFLFSVNYSKNSRKNKDLQILENSFNATNHFHICTYKLNKI